MERRLPFNRQIIQARLTSHIPRKDVNILYIGKTRSPIVVVILSLITCGIYSLYWYYTIMEDMNKSLNRDYLSSALMLILAIVCFPVAWYILYKVDQGLVEVCHQEGVPYRENFILWLLLSLAFGVGVIVAMVQITTAYNNLWANRSHGQLV